MRAYAIAGFAVLSLVALFSGCWSALYVIDGQRARTTNASLSVCKHALQAEGIGPGQARIPDIDRVCTSLVDANAMPNLVWHDCVTYACSALHGCTDRQVSVIDRACNATMPHNPEWFTEIK